MPKKTLALALVKKAGYSTYRSEKLVDIVIGLFKRALGDGKSVDLGKLGLLKIVTRKPKRKVTRNLKHVGTALITVNKHKKSVKLRSNIDFSTEEEKIRNRVAFSACRLPERPCDVPNAYRSSSGAVAIVRWRSRAYRVPSRTTLRNK